MSSARLDLLRAHLQAPPPPDVPGRAMPQATTVWDEPFDAAWQVAEALEPRERFAAAQAAELAAARPYLKPGELIIGNNALRPVVTGMPTPYRTGVAVDWGYLELLRVERPEAADRLDALEAYWRAWTAEHGGDAPMTCHASLAYERVLALGLDGLRAYVAGWRDRHVPQRPETAPWYAGLLRVTDGLTALIDAHADAAEAEAAQAAGERRAELERIAAACRQVAHGAPRSFAEATQLFYFLFWVCGHDSPGPLDRHLGSFLERDLDAGVLTRDEAQELVDCLWLKFEEKTAYGCTLAGQLPDGSDATNTLSLLCVESIRRLRLLSPRTAVRWHHGLYRPFYEKVCQCIASGASLPALVNDDALIPALVKRGVKLEHARDYTFVGCGQTYPHGRGHGSYEDVVANSAKPLELALNDGVDPMTGERLGPATGAPETLGTWEAFEAAYRTQLDHHVTTRIEAVNARRERIRDKAVDFLRSLLTWSCVERGLDWHAGGADYSEGMVDMVGLTTVTDSLVAIRRAVYRDRTITLPELVDVLNRDWQDAEPLRRYCLGLPKFGNEDDEADSLAVAEVTRINEHIKSHRTVFGGPWGMDIIGWSGAMLLGEQTGATPDGRRRGESLADCAGPAQGRNTQGLTATLNSVLKLPHADVHGPMVLSLRFPPEVVQGNLGAGLLGTFLATYLLHGGQDLQVSIAGGEEMRAAQEDPASHRDLLVRVGGFSAYFTQLERRFQNDLIARAEMGW